ncbi:aconitase family protein, partial [Staphylococcus epidermidis]|uniref:aconitase family protein n=1 Tax=Staphylococcus epidermidis TaxID=1282 RepID=UPI0037DA140A
MSKLPYSIPLFLQSLLPQHHHFLITDHHIKPLTQFPNQPNQPQLPFKPSPLILQHFTPLPPVLHFPSLRKPINDLRPHINKINPQLPLHLLIHHSLQLHTYPNPQPLQPNMKLQFEPNYQPYQFLNSPTKPFHNYNPLPPPTRILHQLN